jgi:UDP:flavonoid glycosyltransferase YjiC (YdhE family)
VQVFQTLLAFSGNAQPQLAVTRQLVERGHDVQVLAHRAARGRIEATGAQFVAFETAQPSLDLTRRDADTLRDWETRTRLGAGMRLLRNGLFSFVVEVNRECSKRLSTRPADVVLFDWMLTGAAVAAEAAGVPAAALVHCPYPLPVRGAPPLFTGFRPLGGRLGRARDGLLGTVGRRFLAAGLPILNRARADSALAPLDRWEDQLLSTDAIYVMTAPELDFSSRGELPPNVHYVGPAFEPYDAVWRSSPWPEANDDPLVIISLSTSYMNQQALAQRILDAVNGLPIRALLTTGPALDASRLRLPANTRSTPFIAHRTVLPHAALVITHAGWQTINAALADGVPLLCVADGRDQPDNAARVVECGAGARIGKRASSRRLRGAITAALGDPELQRGAARLAVALGRSDGATVVADAVEDLPQSPTVGAAAARLPPNEVGA